MSKITEYNIKPGIYVSKNNKWELLDINQKQLFLNTKEKHLKHVYSMGYTPR